MSTSFNENVIDKFIGEQIFKLHQSGVTGKKIIVKFELKSNSGVFLGESGYAEELEVLFSSGKKITIESVNVTSNIPSGFGVVASTEEEITYLIKGTIH